MTAGGQDWGAIMVRVGRPNAPKWLRLGCDQMGDATYIFPVVCVPRSISLVPGISSDEDCQRQGSGSKVVRVEGL